MTEQKVEKPLASPALLDYLTKCYDRSLSSVSPDASVGDVMFAAGQASVVRKLRADIEEANRKEEDE